ncbi:transmembrane protein, putative (macronuclear) [Tetrahymena thermophila SB210]|uniref:Transmembrane protein, putative n=1 Tax=Tetrahymena thermophila (strain SB210) TaxID=312017 RepID=Q22US9_TETTS|nr:transmembrane protein, putative [Tetrahymena thermophila SB210]EAR89047.2 transmembrane protein, putative [Tetrahymena thermophila SB210]|eukprot:XP_001009292.2 transmembrane protein, putative [Tetrahymena thermophila SB210]
MKNFGILLTSILFLVFIKAQNTYIEFLLCYNMSCYQFEQNCVKDPVCSILWNQFQKCQKRSRYNYQSIQCMDLYIQSYKNTNTGYLIESLHGCYNDCNGANLFVCNSEIENFENCQSSASCYEQQLAEFEKDMQECIIADKDLCKHYQNANQCHIFKSYRCIQQKSYISPVVQYYAGCRLNSNFSMLLAAKAILILVITLFVM